MSYKSYIKDALRTDCDYTNVIGRVVNSKALQLLHGAIGAATEAGELLDAIKKHLFYGKPLDIINLREECGDLFWYLALIADVLGEKNFTDLLATNIKKLRTRYPERFTEDAAINRDLEKEQSVLAESQP